MAWFQNDFTEMFLLYPFTKIAKIVLLYWMKWPPELKIEKPLNDISVVTSMFLLCPFAKIAKMVLLCWTKWLPELKIEKKTFKWLLKNIWTFFYLWRFENFSILTLKARYLKNCLSHCLTIRVLEKCCMPSAYLQWRFDSGERVVARGPLVLISQNALLR